MTECSLFRSLRCISPLRGNCPKSHRSARHITFLLRLSGYAARMTTIVPQKPLRIVYRLLSLVLLGGLAFADTTAPQFSAKTLDGQTVSNGSLRGNVVLLQFWTTWCPVC